MIKENFLTVFSHYSYLNDDPITSKLLKKSDNKKSKKEIIDTLYEEFQRLIPKSTIKKALKKVGY